MLKKTFIFELFLLAIIFASASFKRDSDQSDYQVNYNLKLKDFNAKQMVLVSSIEKANLSSENEMNAIREQINVVRSVLKGLDFWFRYLEPTSYKKINGPLPVEWETEVFEKYEKPYKREGAGLTLAALYLEEETVKKDSLLNMIRASLEATTIYTADSITDNLKSYHHFYLCNRLFLLNLAAIYTTGFECPSPERIIPELRLMLTDIYGTYLAFNKSFPENSLPDNYLDLYKNAITFANQQATEYDKFDHFTFIKEYVNPLFSLNQQLIKQYAVVTKSNVDYTLNKNSASIFSKSLYRGQNPKGVFLRVYDEKILNEIEKIGKLLFYDPLLSGNNLRSCASCHKPTQFFTDTAIATNLRYDRKNYLQRNSPTLINAQYNHLIMADGLHISLQDQTKGVITNSIELACTEKDLLKKVLSCAEYKNAFKDFLKYTH